MPANLTPQYMEAEQRFKQAATQQEKVTCLEEMLRVIPKHKGTDKLQADLKRRLSKLRQEAQKSSGARRAAGPSVVKEGAGQIALVGLPNAGKSALVGALSKAVTEVADYPFTTRKPIPGMVVHENVQIQLVDLPPISRDYMETWLQQIVRNADALLLVVDVSDADALEAVEFACATLAEWKILPVLPGTVTDPEELPVGVVERPALLLGAKYDDPVAEDTWAMIEELYGERWPRLAVSALSGHNLEELRAALYDLLGKIRVYTKAPGKKPDLTAPFTLPRGSTVSDVAATVHKDFAVRLKFARIWGKQKYDGQMVQRDYVVQEEDVIELHV
ncbi:MAG: 50S ribosome-binding GTPase [Candidatus Tectomicrobia bacterium]|nr:50S ribosome-binding GTPase [Candidatus Tectomicrobia bacterium]